MIPHRTTPIENLHVIPPDEALKTLAVDLALGLPVYAYLFRFDPRFFHAVFETHLHTSSLHALVDHRSRNAAAALAACYSKAHFRSWAANRTMHDKTLLIPDAGIVWFTTANMTRGSWQLSLNATLRSTSHPVSITLLARFLEHWRNARAVLPAARS